MGSRTLANEVHTDPAPPEPGPVPSLAAVRARRFQAALILMGVVWLACEAAALAGHSLSPLWLAYVNLAKDPFYLTALAGNLFIYFLARPSSRDTLLLIVTGILLASGLKYLGPLVEWIAEARGRPDFVPLEYRLLPWANCVCIGLGLASLVMLGRRAWLSRGEERSQALSLFLPACLVPGFTILNLFFLVLSIDLNPTTFDAFLYAADGTLGLQPSYVVGQWFDQVPVLARLAMVIYNTLPLAFVLVFLMQFQVPRLPMGDIFAPYLASAVVGYLIYLTIPVIGPIHVLSGFPHSPPPVADVLASTLTIKEVPRNCMPSLHTTWALLLWWHARPLAGWVRVMAGMYLLFTLLATLGFGVHYALDLVVAFPFALAAQAVCTPSSPLIGPVRRSALVWGSALTLFWLWFVRFGWSWPAFVPAVTVPLVLLTVGISLWQEWALYRAAEAGLVVEHTPCAG